MGGFAGGGGATSGAKAGKMGVKANAKGTFIVHLASANIAIRWLAHRHCLPLQRGHTWRWIDGRSG